MSREKKFTPGPWAVNPVVAQVDEMPSKIPVCKMLWPTEDRSEAETEANANLIAAAPELLEALENAHADIVAMVWGETQDVSTKEEMAEYLHKAIKKAYGETE